MSLNNRIYFRDHQSSVTSGLRVSDQAHATAATSLQFAATGLGSQGLTNDSFQLCTITQTVGLDQGKGDDTSVNGSLVRAATNNFLLMMDFVHYPAPLKEGTSISEWLGVYGRSVSPRSLPKG